MNVLFQLVVRNVKLYLRDRAAVFFSFLSVIIILALYILFLGKMQSDNLADLFEGATGVDWLVSSWIMAGILTVSTVTVPLGAVGKLIDDREKGMINDFYTSPISRNTLALSYLISSWVIGFMMVMVNFIIGQIYVLSQGGEFFTFLELFQMIGLIILSIMTFSSFFFLLSLFIRTANGFSTLATLVGTFIGFLGGIYIPIGVLGKTVQNVMNVLPTAHAVTIMRKVYMAGAIDEVFAGAPQEAYDIYAYFYGLDVTIGDWTMSNWQMVLSMIIFMVVCYSLAVWKLSTSKL
jgi:multidrug/hemolysin transport system permease protein